MNDKEHAPDKPPEGAPCNGCGMCCAEQPCLLAVELMAATVGPCPAMQFEDGRFFCGLVRTPDVYLGTPPQLNAMFGQTFGLALGIGKGCDSDAEPTGEFAED